MTLRKSRPTSLVWLVPILLLATGTRILGLADTNLSNDEAFSVVTSRGPIGELLGLLVTSEPHPPLFPFLLAGWLRVFGSSELVARLPSAFFGIGSVAVAGAIARSWSPKDNRGLAIAGPTLVALLVAVNPFQIWYAQEARMYPQVSFFTGLATLALLRLWQDRRWGAPLYAVALVGAAGSHYYGLWVAVAHGLALFPIARRNPARFGRWIVATAAAALVYLPWVIISLRVFTGYNTGYPRVEELPQVALSSWVRLTAGWSLDGTPLVAGALGLTLIAAIGALAPARSDTDRFARAILISGVLTPFIGGYLVSLIRPMYAERYFIVASLPFILLVARGITWLLLFFGHLSRAPGRWVVPRFIAGSLGVAGLGYTLGFAYAALHNVWIGNYPRSAYQFHTGIIDAFSRPGDVVILNGPPQKQVYAYYARNSLPSVIVPIHDPIDPDATRAKLAAVAATYRGGWMIWYSNGQYDPADVVGRSLATSGYLSFDEYKANARLQYYALQPPAPLTPHATSITFGNELALLQFAWPDASVGAGTTIPVQFDWRALAGTLNQPRVALRLVDGSGFTWAQTDQDIGGGYAPVGAWTNGELRGDRHGLMVPDGTPPGDYLVLLNVYSSDHTQPFQPIGSGADIGPGGITLASLRVKSPSTVAWTPGLAGFRNVGATPDLSLALVGSVGSDEITAGASGYLTIIWKALTPAPPFRRLRLELIGMDQVIAEQRDVDLATAFYPTTSWQAGDVLREQYRVPVRSQIAPGTYQLAVDLLEPSSEARNHPVVVGTVRIQAGEPAIPIASPAHSLDAMLGDGISLAGFDLGDGPVRAGATIDLSLHWTDRAPVDGDYNVFVHVLNASDQIVAQQDQPPAAGSRPTSSWFPGDTILDHYAIAVPASVAPGDYAIEVGMYNPSNGRRLPVTLVGHAPSDHLSLTHLHIAVAQ